MTTQAETQPRLPRAGVRMAADFRCALAAETEWAKVLPAESVFDPLALTGESLALATSRKRSQMLNAVGIAQPSRLLRSHAEGEITGPMTLALLRRLLPAILSVAPAEDAPAAGKKTQDTRSGIVPLAAGLFPTGWAPDAMLAASDRALASLAFVRRFEGDVGWQEFAGCKLAECDLGLDAGGAVMRARLIGGARRPRAVVKLADTARPSATPPPGLDLASSHLALRLDNGDVLASRGALLLTGWRLAVRRLGMRPIFTLGGMAPALIGDGLLAVTGSLTLLANRATATLVDRLADPLVAAARPLAMQLWLDDGAGDGVIFDLPSLIATTSSTRALAVAQPASMTLDFEAVRVDGGGAIMRVGFLSKPGADATPKPDRNSD